MKFQSECLAVLNKIKEKTAASRNQKNLPTDINWADVAAFSKPSVQEDFSYWQNLELKALTFGEYNIRSETTKQIYQDHVDSLPVRSSVEDYLAYEEANDPHLLSFMLEMNKLQTELSIDASQSQTTIGGKKGGLLIVLSTGNGDLLQNMLRLIEPTCLCLVVNSPEDFLSSSNAINWMDIWNEYCSNPLKSIHAIYPPESAESLIRGLGQENLLALDHAYVCITQAASNTAVQFYKDLIKATELSRNFLDYLGFSLDEFHMLYTSSMSLAREPKIYSAPNKPIGGKYLVCGSGPSLDVNIENIRFLSQTHHVIACASNYKTLRANDIRVDCLCMLERGIKEYENYSSVINQFGKDNAVLVASTTCHEGLQDLFDKSCVYYRPALTPMALFCNSFREVLEHEGPQTVNTGVSFALSLGADQVVLCGIDLGCSSLENKRSSQAAGFTDRTFDLKHRGNFSDEIFTNKLMLDSLMNLEIGINFYKQFSNTKIYNIGDGIFIEGTNPILFDQYKMTYCDQRDASDISLINSWYSQLLTYNKKSLVSRFTTKNPYQDILTLKNTITSILQDESCPDQCSKKIFSALKLSSGGQTTLGVRLTRAFILKSLYSILRELYVIGESHNQYHVYWRKSRQSLLAYCDILFDQCIDLVEIIMCKLANS